MENILAHKELRHMDEIPANEELWHMAQEETQHNAYNEEESKNQVIDFLHYFLKMLSDPKATNKLTHMLTWWKLSSKSMR